MRPFILASLALNLCLSYVTYADWPRFRGPNGSGIAEEGPAPPAKWSPTENLRWKAALPGPGVSSPIVVGDRVLLTSYSGYGDGGGRGGRIEDLKRHLTCFDVKSGEKLWERTIEAYQPEDPYSGMGVPSHGYASHTPVSDGTNVYAFFGKSGVHAFSLDGDPKWTAEVGHGSDRRRWGSSSSPVLFEDLLIVTASAESESLYGFDKSTGKQVWQQETSGVADVWGTPVFSKVDENRIDLVLGVPYEIWGLNPRTGKLRWYSEATGSDQYSSSVVEAGGVIFGIEGRGGGSVAVKAGGKGDVSDKLIQWSGRDSSRFGTPLVYQDRVYYFSNGIANCISAGDGSEVFRGRLGGGSSSSASPRGRGGRGGFGSQDYGSPVAAAGHIYYVRRSGETYVLKAGDEFELLSTNRLTEDSENFSGTPAISDGALFIRSNRNLYCVGSAQK